ncbi:MAG: serine/threonine-protein phosphatase [Acinetobacter sp.]
MNIYVLTQKGANHSENEDRILIGHMVAAQGATSVEVADGILAIADGVGGNQAGAIASQFVVTQLCNEQHVSSETFARINQELFHLSLEKPEYNNMASTLTGIYIADHCTTLFSVGNTRVYLLQSNKYIKQLTKDDTTIQYLRDAAQLTTAEVEQFNRKNEITACFGGGRLDLCKIKISKLEPITVPLMMTSDGIHDYVTPDQIEAIIMECGISLSACEEILSLARNAGSSDDISIMLGDV